MDLEFIQSEHDSPEELREFKKQLALKIEKLSAEIRRTSGIFSYLKATRDAGYLSSLSEVSDVTSPESRIEKKQGSSDYHRLKIENLRQELEAKID